MNRQFLHNLLPLFSAILIVFIAFAPVIRSPNAFLLGNSPDAIKNYYNVAYYVKHGSGALSHTGVNYPHGESLLFLDSQPLISKCLIEINRFIPVENHTIGILNLLMLLAFPISAFFFFMILRELGLNTWQSLLFSLSITFLSPQLDRIHGHYALSYACIYSSILFFWLRYLKSERPWNGWSLALFITAIFSAFLHPYHLAIYTVFGLGLLIFSFILSGHWTKKRMLTLLVICLGPILMYFSITKLVDPTPDRPIDPYGFFQYHANFWSIFLPGEGSFSKLIRQAFQPSYPWEGRAFAGSVPILLFGLLGYYVLRHRKQWRTILEDSFSKPLGLLLLASILTLVFAMGIPLIWMESVVDLLSPLKQFRALGRFAWPFYYVFGIGGAYLLVNYYRNSPESPTIKQFIFFGLLLLWMSESAHHLYHKRKPWVDNNKFEANSENYLEHFGNVSITDYQGILALPYHATCADKLHFGRGYSAMVEAMKCSFHTGLPLLHSVSPRNSISETLAGIQLISNPGIPKTNLDHLDNRPLLLLTTPETKNEEEQFLARTSDTIWADEFITIQELPIATFRERRESFLARYDDFAASVSCENQVCTENSNHLDFTSYDEWDQDGIDGSPALFIRKTRDSAIYQKQLDPGDYQFGCWIKIDKRKHGMPELKYQLRTQDDIREEKKIETRSIYNVFNGWARIDWFWTVLDSDHNHVFLISGEYITIDHVFVKPQNLNFSLERDSSVWFNGFPIP